MGKVVFNSKIKRFIEKNREVLDFALERMGKDGVNLTRMRIPYKEGDLYDAVEWVKLEVLNHIIRIEKEYAGYQEFGRRKDGSKVVINYSTPNTGSNFLRGAGEILKRDALNYLKQAAQSVYNRL